MKDRSRSSSINFEDAYLSKDPLLNSPSQLRPTGSELAGAKRALGSTVLAIAAWAVLGCLGRIGLGYAILPKARIDTAGTLIYYDYIPNFVGSLMMGLIFTLEPFIKKKHPIFYDGFGTGFLGSLTTFSSWSFSLSENLVCHSDSSVAVSIWHRVVFFMISLYIHLTSTIIAYLIGVEIAKKYKHEFEDVPDSKLNPTKHVFVWSSFFFLVFCGGVAFVVGEWVFNGDDTLYKFVLALCLAPVGALTRFTLGKWMNPISPKFPFGTFVANITATIINGAVFYSNMQASTPFWVMKGVMIGLDGCLSTMSTFMKEVITMWNKPGLDRRWSLTYIAVSVATAQFCVGWFVYYSGCQLQIP